MIPSTFPFEGFADPQENYYRLPNNWFDICRLLREKYSTRIIAPLKLLEFILKHTWGYRRFDGQVRLTADEVCNGRRHKGKRIDRGTGLAENSVRRASEILHRVGLIELFQDDTDQARRVRSYRPRLRDDDSDAEPHTDPSAFAGFDLPTENYFRVPCAWTDLQREIDSAVTILVTEYFFRHGWGYHNRNGVWLDAEQVVHGRRYQSGRRYDPGIGFDVSSVYRSMEDAVRRGLLVWIDMQEQTTTRRLYNLRLQGMPVADDGRYVGRLPWGEPDEPDQDPERAAQDGVSPSRNVEEGSGELEAGLDGSPAKPVCDVEEGSCNLEEVTCKVEEVNCEVEEANREVEARSATPHTLKDTSSKHFVKTLIATTKASAAELHSTPDRPLCAVVVAGREDEFLGQLGITQPARGRILKADIAPDTLLAWSLYAWAQPGLNQNKVGFFVKRLLASDEPNSPPADFLLLAQLSSREWLALLNHRQATRQSATAAESDGFKALRLIWLRAYRTLSPDSLPPGIAEFLDKQASSLGIQLPQGIATVHYPGETYSPHGGWQRNWDDCYDA